MRSQFWSKPHFHQTVRATALFGLFYGLCCYPTLKRVHDDKLLRERRDRLEILQSACHTYVHDHIDAYPPDLRSLFPHYLDPESYLAYATNEVEYFPGLTNTSNPASILLREKEFDASGQRWAGHLDDSLELMEPNAPDRSPARQP